MLQTLDAPAARYNELENYWAGTQPLAFLAPEARTALGNRLDRMVSNIPRVAVDSLAERLRVTGFIGADVWSEWLGNQMDQVSPVVHREALLLGRSYVIVWADGSGRPVIMPSRRIRFVTSRM